MSVIRFLVKIRHCRPLAHQKTPIYMPILRDDDNHSSHMGRRQADAVIRGLGAVHWSDPGTFVRICYFKHAIHF